MSKNLKIQKRLLLLVAIATVIALVVGYKLARFSNSWLITLSFFAATSLMCMVLIHQTALLKPYINFLQLGIGSMKLKYNQLVRHRSGPNKRASTVLAYARRLAKRHVWKGASRKDKRRA